MVKGDLLNDPNPPGPKFKKENLYWQVLKSWMISQPLIQLVSYNNSISFI
jgi:hypothetical protein